MILDIGELFFLKLEVGSWKLEDGRRKTEVGSWKLEDGSWKTEVGRRKLEDGRLSLLNKVYILIILPPIY